MLYEGIGSDRHISSARRLPAGRCDVCRSTSFSNDTDSRHHPPRWQKVLDEKLAVQQQELDQLHSEIAQSQLRERRALLAAESASQELASVRRNGASPFVVETAQPLIQPHAVRAAVLGREILSELKSRRILDRGDTDGVAADLWVLNGEFPIVQAGSERSVADGLPVFAGRCIVGRIVDAGRWTSSLQFVTEPGFRARAVIARVDADGAANTPTQFSFGSEGLIEGRSELKQIGLCELAQIPVTEQVDVGMPVYSPPGHAVDAPMLFGHVVSAEVPPGALHWVINVRPAVDPKNITNVEIVVPKLSTDFESPNSETDLANDDVRNRFSPSGHIPKSKAVVSQKSDSRMSGNVLHRASEGSDS